MTSSSRPAERLSAAEVRAYLVIAAVSVVTSPITAIFALVVGLGLGIAGACWGASSRSGRGRRRGVRVLLCGVAVLAGPLVYLVLAVAGRLADR